MVFSKVCVDFFLFFEWFVYLTVKSFCSPSNVLNITSPPWDHLTPRCWEFSFISFQCLKRSLPLTQMQSSRIAKVPSMSKAKTKQKTQHKTQETGDGCKDKFTHLDNLATKCSSSELCWLVQLHGASYTGAEKEVGPREMP